MNTLLYSLAAFVVSGALALGVPASPNPVGAVASLDGGGSCDGAHEAGGDDPARLVSEVATLHGVRPSTPMEAWPADAVALAALGVLQEPLRRAATSMETSFDLAVQAANGSPLTP